MDGGREIEVVYYGDRVTREEGPVAGLHVCPSCSCGFVQPIDWAEAGPGQWDVSLRCPSCQWGGGGVFDQDLVERYEEELSLGWEALACDLERLERANMEEQVDRFLAALDGGHIWPIDF